MRIALLFLLLSLPLAAAEAPRVLAARKSHREEIAALFAAAKVSYPARAILLRAFKDESELELWAGPDADAKLTRITTYKVCAKSGGPGPKLQEGDSQVPEGFYSISRLNPWSNFHLSMQVDYPNKADRIRSKAAGIHALGGDIFIHGNCVTIGCLPIQDGPIEQLYLIVEDARAQKANIAVHIFPARPGSPRFAALEEAAGESTKAFWESLRPIYDSFEASHRLPQIEIGDDGAYRIRKAAGK